MFLNILFSSLGLLLFLFLFWKRLKEDYPSNMIFNTAFYVILGMVVSNFLAAKFFPSWWFWLIFLGILVGLFVGILKYKMRSLETLEASVAGFLPWLSLIFLGDSIQNSSTSSIMAFFVLLALIFLFYFLNKHYKGFRWYKSGRVGFSGMATLGALFLIRAVVAVALPSVLSFVGKIDVILSATVAFLAYLLLFNLARKTT